MEKLWTSKTKIIFVLLVTLLAGAHLAWDYFNGGVPSHHILRREDLPSVSNWWGILLLPGLTLYTLWRLEGRLASDRNTLKKALWGFLGALIFGALLSLFFVLETKLPGYMMLALLASSFFIPFYRIEYLLGFVLSMFITFGGVLPVGVGAILVLIDVFSYLIVRKGILMIYRKVIG